MNLRRIFANAIARRVAYVVVAMVLAWLGPSNDARAGEFGCDSEIPATCTREEAYQAALAHQQLRVSQGKSPGVIVQAGSVLNPPPGGYYHLRCGSVECYGGGRGNYHYYGCPAGTEWNEAEKKCMGNECPNKPPLSGGMVRSVGLNGLPESHPNSCPLSTCSAGCEYEDQGTNHSYYVIDGVAWCSVSGWAPSGQQCSASPTMPEPGTPPTDSDGDGTSDEYDLSPNNPGESGDGSGQDVSRACGGLGQPECLPDGSNEGSGRGNTSGGGGDCNTPPRSSGDAILAQIAFQTWATRCAIVATANQGSGTGTGEGEGDQPNWTKGEGQEAPVDDTDYVTQQTRFGLPVSTDLLDQENIFGSASCEHFSIPIWRGVTVSTSDFDGWCTLQAILRGLILIFGAFTAIQILLGKW